MANNEDLDNRVRSLISSRGESFESLSDRTTVVVLSMVLLAYSGGKIKSTTAEALVERLGSSQIFKEFIREALMKHNYDFLGSKRKLPLARRIGQRLTSLESVLEETKEETKESDVEGIRESVLEEIKGSILEGIQGSILEGIQGSIVEEIKRKIKEEIKEEVDSRPSKRARTAAGKRMPHIVLSCAFLLTNHVPGPDDWFTLCNTDDGL
jgi:hypothetical protein